MLGLQGASVVVTHDQKHASNQPQSTDASIERVPTRGCRAEAKGSAIAAQRSSDEGGRVELACDQEPLMPKPMKGHACNHGTSRFHMIDNRHHAALSSITCNTRLIKGLTKLMLRAHPSVKYTSKMMDTFPSTFKQCD
jgi:hypothetical protein